MSQVLVRLLQECALAEDPDRIYPVGTVFSVQPNEATRLIRKGVAELAADAHTQLEFAIDTGMEKRKARQQWH